MPLASVPILVGWLWLAGIMAATVAEPREHLDHPGYCIGYRYGEWTGISWYEHFVPYPIRRGHGHRNAEIGAKDKCTGETFNGQWWFKP